MAWYRTLVRDWLKTTVYLIINQSSEPRGKDELNKPLILFLYHVVLVYFIVSPAMFSILESWLSSQCDPISTCKCPLWLPKQFVSDQFGNYTLRLTLQVLFDQLTFLLSNWIQFSTFIDHRPKHTKPHALHFSLFQRLKDDKQYVNSRRKRHIHSPSYKAL